MKPVQEQKCPDCGAPLRFDPTLGKLVCDYCGAHVDVSGSVDEEDPVLQDLDFGVFTVQASDPNAQALPVYNCLSCGAEVIAAAEQAALTCPYCGNNIVLTDKVSGKLRPDGVIPFRIDAASLPAAMKRFYKDKVLLPKGFFSESSMSKVTGVYVPFWVFGGTLSGALHYRAERSGGSYREGDYIVSEIDHFHLSRDVSVSFEDLPVDASGRIDDALMDSLEPFDIAGAKPFDMRYLAGFTADRFDQEKDDMAQRARSRMLATAESVAISEVERQYDSVMKAGGGLRADLRARYLLLPVYLFDLAYGGKTFHFAVNGQTGKVVGSIPTDGKLSLRYFLVRALPVAGGVLLFSIVRYFLGG